MSQEEKRLIQNKYEIVSKIKQGGFGIVYKGYDHVFQKPVAIKAIEPSLLREAKYIDLFLEEAKNAGKLSHHNIVHIFNLVRDESGQFFIIMEYVNGADLGKILRQCRKKNILIPQELSTFIVKEICKALEYAHNKRDLISDKPLKLVHQDISPSNIMTSRTGHVKLIDFGLAKIRFQNKNSNEIVVSGKLPYMAPEQVNGGTIDRRTDIFSLGTVFYEMLTGSRLVPLDDPHQMIDLIQRSTVDTYLLARNNVPQSVQQVLLKMLQKNPESRYHGANGVYLDLVECLMTTVRTVELSAKLGEFVRELIDSDGAVDDQSASAFPSDIPIDEDETEPHFEQSKDLSQEAEEIKESAESKQFEIKEPDIGIGILTEKLQESTLKDIEDDKKIAAVESQKIKDLEPAHSTETVSGIVEVPSREAAELIGGENQDTNIDMAEDVTESQIESMTMDEQDSEVIKGTSPDESKSSIHDEKVTVDKKISNEINKIFDSDIVSEDRLTIKTKVEDGKKIEAPHTIPSIYGEEEGEDDVKTVIDVIRLSTKGHKKVFTVAGVSVINAFILFLIFDIMFQFTSLGEGFYNRLFPPAIQITSLPTGAMVYIDNKAIAGKTPLSIPKIVPGVHELKLTYPGFSPLIKSIHVPSKGEVKVAGEKIRKGYDPYLFRFKSHIDINSEPSGATVYINQLFYPHKTPTTIVWEVGNPLYIEMEQDGFQRLSGFKLNTLEGIEEIEDRRLWSFNTIEEEYKRYVVEGLFKKFITISCIPSGANFYIDGSSTPSGRTGALSVIALTMGKHAILFQKAGFNSRTVNLNVDKDGPESISVMLTRNVRFFAKDKEDLGNYEIGATIVMIIQNNRSYRRNDRTPCEISLPPVNLQVVLSKEGYKDAIVNVSARDKEVVVKMEPAVVDVEILVKDALTGLPLKDAQISYRSLTNDQVREAYYGATNENGQYMNKLAPGEYSFKVKKFGYFEKYAILNTKTGKNKLEFKLIIQ